MIRNVSEGMRIIFLLLSVALPLLAEAPNKDLSLSDLEQRLKTIDSELDQLASASLLSGVGPIGFRSRTHQKERNTEWIQIEFEQEQAIDEIVLVPTIWRDTKTGFRDDGFPQEFKAIAGTGSDSEGTVIARFSAKDQLSPRIAPVVIPCPGTKASWIRIEASVLTQRAWDHLYILQISEIFVFSDQENVALRQEVTTSSLDGPNIPARSKDYLVDGFVPYLMDAAQGYQSLAFVSSIVSDTPEIIIDLGASHNINRIHLHATDLSDTVPQSAAVDFGVPRHLLVEGSMKSDFSDDVPLVKYRMESIYDTGPIITRRFPEKTCRYLRLTALEPYPVTLGDVTGFQIGFAEIEVFSHGRNVARGRTATCNFDLISPERSVAALTDGMNLYGQILPTRSWLNELALRHQLEVERPIIAAVIDQRHERQKTLVNRLTWLAVTLAAGIILTLLITRIVQMRHVAKIRERLAADLHDELGANLHTIGLLSDLAAESGDNPEQLTTLHRRIRSETERSGLAVRHCTDMLEANGVSSDFEEDMRRASRRIMSKLEHEITIEGLEFINTLNRRARYDLFLFYKECLVNISRHAHATEFSTHLQADKKRILLNISDNGHGISESLNGKVPSSLRRRARILRGKVTVDRPECGGTRVSLLLPIRRLNRIQA